MISSLIAALRGLEIEPSAEEVADAVWLALHMWGPPRDPASERSDSGAARGEKEPEPGPEPGSRQAPKDRAGGGTIQQEADDSLTEAERRWSLHVSRPQQGARATAGSATPIRSPAAQALPGALDLNRALRPLMRRVPSRRLTIFDEEATAGRIAEEGLWVPVLRPALARRFDVALVADDSASMRVWRQTVVEFQRLLERQGAFRDVRLWRLKSDAPGDEVPLYASGRMARRHPRELIDPAGRRLILLLTDCVSRAWEGRHLPQLLAEWGQRNHVAIVQMLPQRLWPQTALFEAEFFSVRAPAPGARTPESLGVARRGRRGGREVVFPILTLDARPIRGVGPGWWSAPACVGSGGHFRR